MLALAGQTAGPNWLYFFLEPMVSNTGEKTELKLRIIFFQNSMYLFSQLVR